MPRITCDSHAVNRVIIVLSEHAQKHEYRGGRYYLCNECQKKVSENIPIALDVKIARDWARRREDENALGSFQKREAKVMQWLNRNSDVWEEFCRLADEMRAVRSNSSAWLVMQVIRWNSLIKTDGVDYKISNDVIAFCARRYMRSHPDRRRFFEIKPMNGENFDLTKRECGYAPRTENSEYSATG